MNPELRRNLWLQLSPQRLIAAPVALGIVFGLGWLTAPQWLSSIGLTIFYLLIGFWGTRRAADTLAEETAGGTWDGQRLSSLGAWAMARRWRRPRDRLPAFWSSRSAIERRSAARRTAPARLAEGTFCTAA